MAAPWPDRVDSHRPLDPSQSQSQPSAAPTPRRLPARSAAPGSRFGTASRVADLEVLQNLRINTESASSSDDEDLHPSRPSRPSHTRSMSHPFPSLFSSKKKKSSPMPLDDSASDSADEPRPNKPQPRGHRNGSSAGSRDYSTGNCMTCGSLVRWPRGLQVFKCTICLTINDLQPQARDSKREAFPNTTSPGADERPSPSETPISIEHTRSLITQSLRSFLASVLRARSRRGSSDLPGLAARKSSLSVSDGRSNGPLPVSSSPARRKASVGYEQRPRMDGPTEPAHRRSPSHQTSNAFRSYSTSYPDARPTLADITCRSPGNQPPSPQPPSPGSEARRMFRPLEDYIVSCFTSFHCINSSFSHYRPSHPAKPSVDEERRRHATEPRRESQQTTDFPIIDLDGKLLLLGDFAENGCWWTGGQRGVVPGRTASNKSENSQSLVSSRSPRIEWTELEEWYLAVVEAARSWPDVYDSLVAEDSGLAVPPNALQEIGAQILSGQEHVQRTLLKACETILKRPGRPIAGPHEIRFLLIISANPLLHASYKPCVGEFKHPENLLSEQSNSNPRNSGPASGRHSGIIKRIVGLISNAPSECHNHLVAWFARCPELRFVQTKDLISGFLAYRLIRQNEKKYEVKVDVTDGLIPSMGAGRSPASLHAALGPSPGSGKKQKERQKKITYQDDWQIKVAAQVLGFLFAANNMGHARRSIASRPDSKGFSTRERVQVRGLATSDFYTTLLDESDLVADFENWERKKGKFSFCQYPFLLSIGAKIQILEHDARRQMENKARDAFFSSIMTHRTIQQYLVLNIRRDCLVDDSLKAVSEVIGAGGEDIKKGLKIVFKGEEGVDGGGLRKEWFLLLVREVFNPDHGMFIYDEDSQYCYFNPNSLEPSEQFFLIGVVFGLAIYNSTILDVALPPFAFRKLLMAAPSPAVTTSQPRQAMMYTLDDLAEYRPNLAHGLRQLLDYDGDVESTFCLDFMVDMEKYGHHERVPLCPAGERRAVTNANRREFVDLYVRYLLDTAVSRQFEPFKRGFFTVCGGNALSLFRPEEIELLVRGSDEPLDIGSLKVVAEYDGWGSADPAENEPTVKWFWDSFEQASPKDQRKLLLFITGSDRIPAMGAASLTIRLACLGPECGRYPTARTCFNTITLWRCSTRERLEHMLWMAVRESEGFGLK
ncbi:hypothetical protein B0T26DRAFT_740165 [Lasiosphaeria miniovina]|uniref:HECT-type E3 ubiquitin transferase n=1 Tax=Lasiosphaeria miniovina TaxID=1954250 RepID=A0AA40AW57_9PEZI|nr:uncharacterized protein B0T26DRAFT_740165 [Lasiosphaeria miniovina]KAK0723137.1 hypothetical protein B0T26DRAFT_740165 [Lasiosphaeria miniovina]